LAIRTGGLSLNILLLVLLLPHIGVQGAAVASLIAEIVVLVLIIRSLTFPPDWWQRVISHTWRLGVAASGLAAVVFVTREIHPILAAVTGVPVYIGLVLVSGAIASDDWDLIYRLAMAMPGGSVIGRYWKRKLV
ncbi:MAG: polysaccharide biosynthesis C-terminal domain-containing protein, partial [Anaerolineae bacterium]|nr:polysaccharide biosynthesis C-terminal domain-containing protein [Anaerolineae bacterium]